MKHLWIWLACAGAGGLHASTVVYTDFGPGMVYTTGSGHLVSAGWGEAQIFTPSVNGALSQIDLGLAYFGSTPQYNLSVSLQTDSAGFEPSGTVLESWSLNTSQITNSASVVSVTSTLTPTLTAGTSYWLVLRANPSDANGYVWLTNNQGFTGLDYDNGTGWQQGLGAQYSANAFDVLANPATTTTAAPEPGAWALLSVAAAGCWIRRRRVTAAHMRARL